MRARFAVVLPLIIGIAACGGSGSDPAAEANSANLSAGSLADGNKVIGVMSRNLYLGADLAPVIAATNLSDFLDATTAAWKMVQKNDFHVRVQALADEIAGKRPALVGLQEAFTWRVGAAPPATTVVYDYAPELLAALAARGVKYRAVARVELLDVEAPTRLGHDVRATDHDVIIARDDVDVMAKSEVVYTHLLPLSVFGATFPLKRGYVTVDVRYRGASLKFVSTHLESFHAGIRMLQAGELATALARESRPVILVGDLNSHPGTEGEAILAAAGFIDGWPAALPANSGLTCCWAEDLTVPQSNTNRFTERIDYVLTRGPLDARAVFVTGGNPSYRVGGLWPSDHGGIFAEVRMR